MGSFVSYFNLILFRRQKFSLLLLRDLCLLAKILNRTLQIRAVTINPLTRKQLILISQQLSKPMDASRYLSDLPMDDAVYHTANDIVFLKRGELGRSPRLRNLKPIVFNLFDEGESDFFEQLYLAMDGVLLRKQPYFLDCLG